VGRYTRQPLRGFRKLAMTFWDAPRDGTIYGTMQFDVTKAQRFQKDVQAKHGITPSMGQLLGKAMAVAATKVPEINGKVIWGRVYLKDTVDMYFQVDIEDGGDLSGVVVPDTGRKSIVDVARELRDRADKLRKGKDEQYEKAQKGCLAGLIPVFLLRQVMGLLTFLEYNFGFTPTFIGARPEPFGTLMISNVSNFGVDIAYAPLVPVSRVPLVCLMGRVRDMPWVDEKGQLCVRPILTGSASMDHRLVDGNKIGKFIRTIRTYMDNPYAYETAIGIPDPDPPAPPSSPAPTSSPSAGPPPSSNGGPPPASGPSAVPSFR
jgi:pyruvate/2-oxoglutarate dehydrogenase complex dihydrolipoamide acyltransferase (E2) component